jgi:hypothetical protein
MSEVISWFQVDYYCDLAEPGRATYPCMWISFLSRAKAGAGFENG